MNKPKITDGEWKEIGYSMVSTEYYGAVADCEFLELRDEMCNNANAKAISAVPEMIDALIKVQALWWNEVYEFGYDKYEGDFVKAKKLADNDAYNVMMVEALKKAGCTMEYEG